MPRFALSTLKQQAAHVQKQFPDLYEFLVQRDEALREIVGELHGAVDLQRLPTNRPNPREFEIIEVVRPSESGDCPICKNPSLVDPWGLLPPNVRDRVADGLCTICERGLIVVRSGVRSLAEG